MIHLIFSDLWEHRHVWVAVGAVAAAFGYMGGWFCSFTATAAMDPAADWAFFFKSAAQAILMFSSVSAVFALLSTARGCVIALRGVYALWQLINVSPSLVGCAVLAQVVLTAGAGACVGLLVQRVSSSMVFAMLCKGIGLFDGVNLQLGDSLYPVIVGTSMFVSLLGGFRAARTAMRTSALMALRDERSFDVATTHMSPARWLAAFTACGAIAWSVSTVNPALVSIDSGQSTWLAVLPLAVPALFAMLAPMILPRALDACAKAPARGAAWSVACRGARQSLAHSTTIEVSLLIAAGIVGGWYSMMRLMERYYLAYELPVGSGFDIDPRLACVMFGGPVLLAAVGAYANVVLSLRSRKRDVSLLEVLGAGRCTVVLVAALEAAVHVFAAGAFAALSALVSNVLSASVLGLTFADAIASLQAVPAVFILAVGFFLLVGAEMLPLLQVCRGVAIRFLAREG